MKDQIRKKYKGWVSSVTLTSHYMDKKLPRVEHTFPYVSKND